MLCTICFNNINRMKKLLLSLSFLVLSGIIASGQTTATDFTATDCSASSHTLFTELDAGKIIVLVWVEPCGGCISDAKAGYDAVHSFGSSNPGRVFYWLTDDVGNTDCATLNSWASANGIVPMNITEFDNTGNVIDEANYGGTGMPHVVVLGGTNHHIYYNQLSGSSDGAAITSAINNALSGATEVGEVANAANEFKLFPNPAKDKISVSYYIENPAAVTLAIYDIIGNEVQKIVYKEQSHGQHSVDINFENKLADGMYFLNVNTGNVSNAIKFIVAN